MNRESLKIPRTLIVDISANFGGANARVLALMKKFPTDSIGLATIDGSMIAPELEGMGYLVHYLAENKFDPRIPFRMTRVIQQLKYQVLDAQNPQSKLWASIAAFWSGAALVSTLNSWYMNEHPRYSLRWFIYSALEFLTNFSLSRYIVVSSEIEKAMLVAGISATRIDLIYNAVELDVDMIDGDKKKFLDKYNLPSNAIICIAAGRLAWAKAHDDLISAMAIARRGNSRLYCLIAGEGELEGELRAQIKRAELDEYVLLPGNVAHAELLSCLKTSDIYVMPSRTEGTPVALLEAAMLGRPIVASNVGGIPEMVVNEEHALLIEVGDVEGLAAALLRVAGDEALADRLGKQARARVKTHFSIAVQAQLTSESYIRASGKLT
jgi:glycosyltransferase involved in cell wall biosynthesis